MIYVWQKRTHEKFITAFRIIYNQSWAVARGRGGLFNEWKSRCAGRLIKRGGLRQRNLDNSPRVVGLMRSLKFNIFHRLTSEVARVRMPVGMFTQPNSNTLNL